MIKLSLIRKSLIVTVAVAGGAAMPLPAAQEPSRTPVSFVSTPIPMPSGSTGNMATSGGLPRIEPGTFGKLKTNNLPEENSEKIVARVNGQAISVSLLLEEIKRAAGARVASDPQALSDHEAALAVPLLDQLIQKQLVLQFARKNNLEPSDAEIRARINAANKARPDGGKLEDEAAALGLGPASVQRVVKSEIARENVAKFIGDLATSTTPSQKEVETTLRERGVQTTPVVTLRAAHIVWRATPDMSPGNIADAKAKAEEVQKRIEDGLDFNQAARSYSQDRFTAYKGGDLGYFNKGDMNPQFEEAAFALQPGQISEIVRTPVGFHLIRVTEKHPDNGRVLYEQIRRDLAIAQWTQDSNARAEIIRYLK